ncbi:aminotransferase class I/II-fold pyridoxal phosphate-dependent enzyme [Paenibacillus soyae]|uniref:Aminotransferase n=1 Tax=Paenibacillus soyae TaxID=2969249 RepID=A0A9X2S6S4_9BACL|nr:aminotransferase class I/II-fold pyridoxal phosphate-dependent enzyme [Paenibacillus soyae]MCR2802280.1 aminotransferase class I/II-fold pyridoxal phosphate-dependent enzyme [Paenibacillus soyae]
MKMQIEPFALEKWQNKHGKQARFNLADTCADCMTLEKLLSLGSASHEGQLAELLELKLTYGEIQGSPELRRLVAKRYAGLTADGIIMMNGAAAANALVMHTLLVPGDRVVSFHPTYQQLHAFPTSLGAEVVLVPLRPKNRFQPDMEELRRAVTPRTKLILLNNPNNPTGTLLDKPMLDSIVAIARSCGAYILSDEICMDLPADERSDSISSIADLYERGIATSSLSKAMSLAALRIGWIACHDRDIISQCMKMRDYTTIGCGALTDRLAAMALARHDSILAHSRQLLRTNLDLLKKWSAEEETISFIPPQGGTSALLRLPSIEGSEAYCKQLLTETGVLLVPGSCFGLEGYVRIGCAMNPDVLRQGLERISDFQEKNSSTAGAGVP